MRYLLDENLVPRLALLLRQFGRNADHVRDLGRGGLSDEQQLIFAAEQGYVFISRDYGDIPRLAERFHDEQRPHAGAFILPRSLTNADISGMVAAIMQFEQEHPESMLPYETVWLRRASR